MSASSTTKSVQVYAEDVEPDLRTAAIEISQNAFGMTLTTGKVFGTIATTIRSELDKGFGGTGWNCIVGGSFGTAVTHEQKSYM